eukprot:TRINITY_DN617_c0_g1_i2.p1 TRINITY_DN617_c0_g1~~TRINITY_DN617_c0_g1_i2.p1  ORF type:complete len:432 (-),score=35.69 TRINITY_DN617_c0_g1_i2:197-1492(-)
MSRAVRLLLTLLALLHTAFVRCDTPTQRVRREIRELGAVEREAVFSALNIMKNTSDADGKARYGARFTSYDTLSMIHFVASSDERGDMAHLGPAFPTFHRAFGLMAEESLMAIDPLVTALPYWDYNIDYFHPRDSVIWDWFGDSQGDPNNLNAVTNGRFGHWTVANLTDCAPNCFGRKDVKQNPFGLMRSPWNNNPSPRLTRYPLSCETNVTFDTSREVWKTCLDMPTYDAYLVCINPGVHTHAHGLLGGIWNAGKSPFLGRFGCFFEHTFLVAGAWTDGCVECPTHCNSPGDLSTCECKRKTANRSACSAVQSRINPVATMGDFADTWTSANEPMFFFHHANIDRHVTVWQKKHRKKAPDYGYPVKWGLNRGQDLDHVIADRTPFDPTIAGLPSSHGPLTHKDLIRMDGVTAFTPYTYDRLESPYWPADP